MSDSMFPGSNTLGDSISKLFGTGPSEQANLMSQLRMQTRANVAQDQGVNKNVYNPDKNAAAQNSPQYGNEKNRPATAENPQDVEDRWMARLAKFAGIAQATGVKI